VKCFWNCLNTIWLWFFMGSRFKRTTILIKGKNNRQVAGLSVKIAKEKNSGGQCCTLSVLWQAILQELFGSLNQGWRHVLNHLAAKVSLIHQLKTFDVSTYLAMTSVAIQKTSRSMLVKQPCNQTSLLQH
jgi:hypothetical protein